MRDIGHFEFGELHRPIDFPGVEGLRSSYSPDSLKYWIGYWTAAFKHILDEDDRILLLSYDRLCEEGASSFPVLEDRCHLPAGSLTAAAEGLLRAPTRYAWEGDDSVGDLLEQAELVHTKLLERSIV